MAFLYAIQRNQRRAYKQKLSLDSLTDDEIYGTTRFPRSAVEDLCEMVSVDIERATRRAQALDVESQVLAALQFYSSGSFQWVVGRSSGLSQPSVCRAVNGVTDALCKHAHEHIVFPASRQALLANKLQFSAIAGLPNTIGAIDCTHIPIKAPASHEDVYVNRKGVHTVNVQAVCDADMTILDLVAKWPGSTHDSLIWRASRLHSMFEQGDIEGGWLLGMLVVVCLILIKFLLNA